LASIDGSEWQVANDSSCPEMLGPILSQRFKAYAADIKGSVIQLFTTAVPFIALMVVMEADPLVLIEGGADGSPRRDSPDQS